MKLSRKFIVATFAMMTVLLLIGGKPAEINDTKDVVRARRFELIGKDGLKIGSFASTEEGGAKLELDGGKEQCSIVISADKNGNAGIDLLSRDNLPRLRLGIHDSSSLINISDGKYESNIYMVTTEGGAALKLSGKESRAGAIIHVYRDGSVEMHLANQKKTRTIKP